MMLKRTVVALGTAIALATATVALATSASAETVPGSARYVVNGHGFGHGHGMSQYGARAAATDGRSWRDIVAFYYPGTAVGHSSGEIKVLITKATKRSVTVGSQQGLTLKRVGKPTRWSLARIRPHAELWRATPHGKHTVISYRIARQWRRLTTTVGDVEFTSGGAPINLQLPNGDRVGYRGSLRATQGKTVNVLPLDQYLRGVVASEMPSYWPAQALSAQAIAARTYAAYQRAHPTHPGYDICDAESCQVYTGYNGETEATDRSVRATRGMVVLYQGAPAYAQYSASNGGQSSAGSTPYLVSQVDPFETSSHNPNTNWGPIPYSEAELEKAWPDVGTITDMSFIRDGAGDYGGWVTSVTITGTEGTTTLSGEDFAFSLDLRSPYLQVQPAPPKSVTGANGHLRPSVAHPREAQ